MMLESRSPERLPIPGAGPSSDRRARRGAPEQSTPVLRPRKNQRYSGGSCQAVGAKAVEQRGQQARRDHRQHLAAAEAAQCQPQAPAAKRNQNVAGGRPNASPRMAFPGWLHARSVNTVLRLKIAVIPPLLTASVAIAMAEKAGLRRSSRTPYLRS